MWGSLNMISDRNFSAIGPLSLLVILDMPFIEFGGSLSGSGRKWGRKRPQVSGDELTVFACNGVGLL